MLKHNGHSLDGKTIAISGAGNVAIYAAEKAMQLGAKVVTMSDSTGWIYDAEGLDLDAVKEIKEVKRARLSEYKNYRPNAEYHEGKGVWSVKCDVALPCATQNELNLDDAKLWLPTAASPLRKAPTCPPPLRPPNISRRTVFCSLPARPQTPAASLHPLWK